MRVRLPAMRDDILELVTTKDGLLRLFGTVLLAVVATCLMLAFQAVL